MEEQHYGNPWIFQKIIYYLNTGKRLKEISKEEKLNIILEHIDMQIKDKGEGIGIKEMRKHLGWYVKNLPDAGSIRDKINKLNSRKEVVDTLSEYFK